MPYDLKELAAISGQPGLYRLLRPARHGVLVETLEAQPRRSLAPASNKVSLLSEIGIYAQDSDETLPLTQVFERIHQQFGQSLPVTSKSSESELTGFLAGVMPEYDRQRVYVSDIKKLVTWYGLVSQHRPYQPAEAATSEEAVAATEAPAGEAPATEASAEAEATEAAAKPTRKRAAKAPAAPEAAAEPEPAKPLRSRKKTAE